MPTIEEIFAEAKTKGWLINNLFQLDEYTWQANVRNADLCFEFGHGSTPQEALRNCLRKAEPATAGKPSTKGWSKNDKRFPNGPGNLSLEDLGL